MRNQQRNIPRQFIPRRGFSLRRMPVVVGRREGNTADVIAIQLDPRWSDKVRVQWSRVEVQDGGAPAAWANVRLASSSLDSRRAASLPAVPRPNAPHPRDQPLNEAAHGTVHKHFGNPLLWSRGIYFSSSIKSGPD